MNARTTLAELIKDKLAIEERLRHLDEQAKRLKLTERAEHEIRARFDALSASEASAMAAWSSGEIKAEPRFDMKARAALEAEIQHAAAQATAARSVAATAVAERGALHEQRRQISRAIELAKGAILIEAIDPMVVELEAMSRKQNRQRLVVGWAVDFIVGVAHEIGKLGTPAPDVEAAKPMLAAVEKINERILTALDSVPDRQRPDAGLRAFFAALSDDAAAQLDLR